MDNLWVADASIFPTVPHANTNLTAIMVGERVSDFIKMACEGTPSAQAQE
jgi:choline dehydrogenase-like flavoprotein